MLAPPHLTEHLPFQRRNSAFDARFCGRHIDARQVVVESMGRLRDSYTHSRGQRRHNADSVILAFSAKSSVIRSRIKARLGRDLEGPIFGP